MNRKFADRAGYTRHCWECIHAKGWRKVFADVSVADCEISGKRVSKFDSPNNPCSHLSAECEYDDGEVLV